MAFHVACPVTCRRICYCDLGFPRDLHGERSKAEFVSNVSKIEEFFKDPWGIAASFAALKNGTVQVLVPKIAPPPPPPLPPPVVADGGGGGGLRAEDDAVAADARARATVVASQSKRDVLQKKAAADVVAAEDFARRFEYGDVEVASKELSGEEQGLSSANVMCSMCFVGEREGSERARKMHSCRSCGKKYHKSCLKSWSQHRDLFHWRSWNCPSCRTCEVYANDYEPVSFNNADI